MSPSCTPKTFHRLVLPFFKYNLGTINLKRIVSNAETIDPEVIDTTLVPIPRSDEVWKISWNRATGTPHRIVGTSKAVLMPVRSDSAIVATARHQLIVLLESLAQKKRKFRDFPYTTLVKNDLNAFDNKYSIRFDQVYETSGLQYKVYGAQAGMTMSTQKDTAYLVQLGVDIFPKVNVKNTLKITQEEAQTIVQNYFQSASPTPDQFQLRYCTPQQTVVLPKIKLKKSILRNIVTKSDSTIPPNQHPNRKYKTKFYLVHQIAISYFESGQLYGWTVYVDAENGRIIEYQNSLNELEGSVKGTFVVDTPSIIYSDPLPLDGVRIESGTDVQFSDKTGKYKISELLPSSSMILDGSLFTIYDWKKEPLQRARYQLNGNLNFVIPSVDEESNSYFHLTKAHNHFIALSESEFMRSKLRFHTTVFIFSEKRTMYNKADSAICLGLFNGEKTALYADAIIHEYTHAVTHRIAPNIVENSKTHPECGALCEGLADYFACSFNNNPLVQPTGRNANDEFTYDDFKNSTSDSLNDFGYIHYNGQIILSLLWELRSRTINSKVCDRLIFDALAVYPPPENFNTFGVNMLLADDNDNYLSNGTTHSDSIIKVFEARKVVLPKFDEERPTVYLRTATKLSTLTDSKMYYYFELIDNGSGIDRNSIIVKLSGVEKEPKISKEPPAFVFDHPGYSKPGKKKETIFISCMDNAGNKTKFKTDITIQVDLPPEDQFSFTDWLSDIGDKISPYFSFLDPVVNFFSRLITSIIDFFKNADGNWLQKIGSFLVMILRYIVLGILLLIVFIFAITVIFSIIKAFFGM